MEWAYRVMSEQSDPAYCLKSRPSSDIGTATKRTVSGGQAHIQTWYRLECGVRQGELTSPKLFKLYMNWLRAPCELSSINVGCHVDGVCVNNLSYADEMVLRSPSISALRKLINVCESYVVAHGLKCNASKSELMMFKAGSTCYKISHPLTLWDAIEALRALQISGSLDNWQAKRENEERCVYVAMLARRFARCSGRVSDPFQSVL